MAGMEISSVRVSKTLARRLRPVISAFCISMQLQKTSMSRLILKSRRGPAKHNWVGHSSGSWCGRSYAHDWHFAMTAPQSMPIPAKQQSSFRPGYAGTLHGLLAVGVSAGVYVCTDATIPRLI
jgi:hypothetical protein